MLGATRNELPTHCTRLPTQGPHWVQHYDEPPLAVPTVTVVLPCLNEAQSLAACVKAARTGLSAAGLMGEVLVVDNGSTDGSAEIAIENGARVVTAAAPGYGSALQVGIREAPGDIIVMADADETYDLTRLGELVRPILDDQADMVLGSRLEGANLGTMPILHRFVGTPLISFLLRRAGGGTGVRDSQSGYRAFRAETIRALDLKATGMEFASEMLIRAGHEGLRITETPIGYRRRTGDSKLRTFADGWRHLQLILLLAPQLLLFWPGIVMFGSGVTLSVLSLFNPEGFAIGTLLWQPIFFAPILIVLGAASAVAGAVLAHHSSLSGPSSARRFAFVGSPRFPSRSATTGVLMLTPGILVEIALFSAWLGTDGSPSRRLVLAGIAQALILVGAMLIGFGLIYRIVVRNVGYRGHAGAVDVLRFVPSPTTEDQIDENRTADG